MTLATCIRPKAIAIHMGGVVQYEWEAYHDTVTWEEHHNRNGSSSASIDLSSGHRGTKSTAIAIHIWM